MTELCCFTGYNGRQSHGKQITAVPDGKLQKLKQANTEK